MAWSTVQTTYLCSMAHELPFMHAVMILLMCLSGGGGGGGGGGSCSHDHYINIMYNIFYANYASLCKLKLFSALFTFLNGNNIV